MVAPLGMSTYFGHGHLVPGTSGGGVRRRVDQCWVGRSEIQVRFGRAPFPAPLRECHYCRQSSAPEVKVEAAVSE